MRGSEETVRDRIYEAAFLPELWPACCDLISAEVGAYSTALTFISPDKIFRAVCSPIIAEPLAEYLQTDFPSENIRMNRQIALGEGFFSRDIDLMTVEELAADPIYQAFLHPRGLGWTAGAIFQEPSGSSLMFDLQRKQDRGAFTTADIERLNRLRPDLARAAFMATRLAFKEAQTITHTLVALGLPGAVLGEAGRCISMNSELEAFAPRVRTGWRDQVQLQNAEANSLFQTALQQLKSSVAPEVLSIPVAAGEDVHPLVIHLVPIRRNARDIFSAAATIMIVTTVGTLGASTSA